MHRLYTQTQLHLLSPNEEQSVSVWRRMDRKAREQLHLLLALQQYSKSAGIVMSLLVLEVIVEEIRYRLH